MNLVVGDVVFVLDKKTQAVVPCQLVERISSVTLQGEATKHIAQTPGGKKFTLEEYESVWFENYEKSYEYLKEAALRLVDSTMQKAVRSAESSFGYKLKELVPTHLSENSFDATDEEATQVEGEEIPSDSDQVFVDIGGQKVKVTLPKEFGIHE